MDSLLLAEETDGYQTSTDPSNTAKTLLIAGSQNVLIAQQKKVTIRPGYTRLGPANSALTPIKNSWRWDTSTGHKRPQRFYNGILEAYLTTVDGTAINAWTKMNPSVALSTTGMLRPALTLVREGGGWFDSAESIDLQLMVQGDDSLFEWGGGIAVVASVRADVGAIAVLASAPTAGGSGYVVGDVLNITDAGTGATARVTAIGGSGAVSALVIVARGSGYATGTGKVTSGGTGTSCTVSITTIGTGGITKAGTTTYGQNRFYATRNKTVTCVRTGTEYTYTDDASTQEIVGVGDTSALVAGDILVQKIKTTAQGSITSGWGAGRHNDVPFIFQNQLCVGSASDAQTYISKNTDYTSYAFSSPRVSGEGGLLTCDGYTRAINALGTYLLVFSGFSSIFRADYQQLTVSTTLAETLRVQKFDVGVKQGALNHECVIPIGNQLAYLTNEVTLRIINNVQNLSGINPSTLSNPIKPDFDAETWTGAFGVYYRTTLIFSAYANGNRQYMLNFNMTANGKTERYWNPPLTYPVAAMTAMDIEDGNGDLLYGHSSTVPETYLLFDGLSDGQYANMQVSDKLPIHAIAKYAYDHMGKRGMLKTHDEYYVEGEISPNTTDIELSLLYDFDGTTGVVQRTINGTDKSILEGSVMNNSLAQSLLAQQPLGGLLTPPADARRFREVFEMARDDYFELSAVFETDEVDRYWSIVAHGSNARLSPRKPVHIKK